MGTQDNSCPPQDYFLNIKERGQTLPLSLHEGWYVVSKSLHNQSFAIARAVETPAHSTKDAKKLLQETVAHLEQAMRLMAQAALLQPELDESLGIEAQRLIGVREAVAAEIHSGED